jgi:tetratricopeptide (TPR) repeat protein
MISEATPSTPPGATELQRRYQDAIAAFDEQLRHNPDNIELLRGRASALLVIGENDRALASYDAILHAHPLDIQALVEKADLLVWLGRYDQALTFLRSGNRV